MSKKILIVEDEEGLLDGLAHNFRYEGYEVLTAKNGQEGLKMALKQKPDAVLLDIMLPEKDGFTVLKELRQRHREIPVLVMTARNFEADVLKGFDLGADDYVTKPFRPRELVARVRAVLRRKGANEIPEVCELEFGPLTIDGRRHEVRVDGRDAHVTRKEFQLLLTMAKEPGKAFSRLELLEKAFGYNYEGLERTIDAHIRNLRKKIERDAERPAFIETVYGLGYRFAEYRDAP